MVYFLGSITDVYVYNLKMWNCNLGETKQWVGNSLTYLVGSGSSQGINEIVNYDYEECCPDNIYYQDISFFGNWHKEANEFIVAGENVTQGTNGPVVITNGAEVIWEAGTNVVLKPGFHAVSGSKFIARVEPCGASANGGVKNIRNRRKELDSFLLKTDNIIAPNVAGYSDDYAVSYASRGNFELVNEKSPFDFYVISIDGRIVLKLNSNDLIQTYNLSNGVYVIRPLDSSLPSKKFVVSN